MSTDVGVSIALSDWTAGEIEDVGSAPVNVSAPSFSGLMITGQTLTATPGTWSGTAPISYAYAWQRDSGSGFVSISGATASTYVLVVADEGTNIRVRVTAINTEGSTVAYSAGVGPSEPAAEADIEVTFGALTLEQQGGVAVAGTSISSGDALGHWRIDSGRIHPSAAGVGNLSGAYNLTLNNAETVAITIEANRRDVRTDAELSAAIAAIDGGTIHLRAGTYGALAITSRVKSNLTTIQSDPASRTLTWGFGLTETFVNRSGDAILSGTNTITGSANWRMKNLRFYRATGPGAAAYVVGYSNNDNVQFERCEIHSDQPTVYSYTQGHLLPSAIGAATNDTESSEIRIVDCLVHSVQQGIEVSVGTGPHVISRNVIRDCYTMFMQLRTGQTSETLATDLTIHGNVGMGIYLTQAETLAYDIHSAMIALQGTSDIQDWDIAGNILLPVYDLARPGGIDLDGSGAPAGMTSTRVVLRGNIVACTQNTGDCRIHNPTGGCHHFGNLYMSNVNSNQTRSGDWSGCMAVYSGTVLTTHGTNYCQHNIVCVEGVHNRGYFGQCVRIGSTYYLTGAPASVTASNNLGIGLGAGFDASAGVITGWPTLTAPGSVTGTSAGARFIDMFNGVNANGDFTNIASVDGLYQTDAHVTALGTWVGALQATDSYVTFAAGHITDPQDVTLDESREPWREVAAAPVNTVAPAITGTAETGETLACSTGTWTGSPTPTYAYAWQRDTGSGFAAISGATSSTYEIVEADEGHDVRCVVTATNSEGSASANSNTVQPEAPAVGGGPIAFLGAAENGGAFGTTVSVTVPNLSAASGFVIVTTVTSTTVSDNGAISTACTVGGATATKIGSAISPNGRYEVAAWSATVSASNGGSVALTVPVNANRVAAAAWAAPDMSVIGHATLYDSDSTTAHTITTTCASGDGIAATILNLGTATATWTGATENYDTVIEATVVHSGATNTNASANQAVTATLSAGSVGATMIAVWVR